MKNDLQTFPVSAGLLDPRHVKAIDPSSPWPIYLWFLEHVTRDEENGEHFDGIVLNGRSVSIRQIADDLGIGERVCRRHLAPLVKAGYVLQKKTGVGTCIYIVTNSKRWAWKRQPRSGRNHPSKAPEIQASLFSSAPDGSGDPTHRKPALGLVDPQAGKRPQGGVPTGRKTVGPDQKQASAERGTRARSHKSQKAHKERGRSRHGLFELPSDFIPGESHRKLAQELHLNLELVFGKFCDHHASKGTKFKDWDRALNTWLRRETEFARSAGPNCIADFRPTPPPPAWSEEVKRLRRAAGIQ